MAKPLKWITVARVGLIFYPKTKLRKQQYTALLNKFSMMVVYTFFQYSLFIHKGQRAW